MVMWDLIRHEQGSGIVISVGYRSIKTRYVRLR